MATSASPDPDAFHAAFAAVAPLVHEEWPGLDAAALAATGGELEVVVALIAEHTDQTRARTRRLLGELLAIATAPTPAPPPVEAEAAAAARPTSTPSPRATSPRASRAEPGASPVEPLDRLVRSLEEHLDDIARQVKQDVTPLAVDTARQHIGLALLLAGGIGLMVGLFLGALGYPQEQADGEP